MSSRRARSALVIVAAAGAAALPYNATWASLDARPLPSWCER